MLGVELAASHPWSPVRNAGKANAGPPCDLSAKNEGVQVNQWNSRKMCVLLVVAATALGSQADANMQEQSTDHGGGWASIQGKELSVRINADGSFSIVRPGISDPVLRSGVEA